MAKKPKRKLYSWLISAAIAVLLTGTEVQYSLNQDLGLSGTVQQIATGLSD